MSMDVARRAADVWRGLSQDERFQAVYGQDPLPIWINAIALLTDAQCKHGVEVANKIADTSPFPVSLAEFEAACREVSGTGAPPARHQSYRQGHAPLARPETRERYLASIRERLK